MFEELNQLDWQTLEQALSKDRLRPYLDTFDNDRELSLKKYFLNIRICESLYPSIQNLEIALRNSINSACEESTENRLWFQLDCFKSWMSADEITKLEEKIYKQELRKGNYFKSEKLASGKLIAEISLGKWVRFFNQEIFNECKLYFNIRKIFPYIPSQLKKDIRKAAYKNLNPILELRNRVFHHEPVIWNLKELKRRHDLIIDIIQWINPKLSELTKRIDRFSDIFNESIYK